MRTVMDRQRFRSLEIFVVSLDFNLDRVYSKLAGVHTRLILKPILTIAGPVDSGDQGMR